MKPELDAPSLQSMEGHLQTSMDVWVDNNNCQNQWHYDFLDLTSGKVIIEHILLEFMVSD